MGCPKQTAVSHPHPFPNIHYPEHHPRHHKQAQRQSPVPSDSKGRTGIFRRAAAAKGLPLGRRSYE